MTGKGDVLWPLLFGSALTLVTTLVAQWFSLAFQTRRQRETRQADGQRTTLLQAREQLGEVDEALARAVVARNTVSDQFYQGEVPDDWTPAFDSLDTSHPELLALRSATYRLCLTAAALEHEALSVDVQEIALWSSRIPYSRTDKDLRSAVAELVDVQERVVHLLGEQLRRLP